jgi:hypothetical protein
MRLAPIWPDSIGTYIQVLYYTDKLSNITPLQVINPDYDMESSETELLAEMKKEWEKDWSEL